MSRRGPGRLFVYPASDGIFQQRAEHSFATIVRGHVTDVGIVAAVEALLRESYPLASVSQIERFAGSGWDVFRDGDVLDVQLALRMQAGDLAAAGRLYDSHASLVYAIAARTTADPELAQTVLIDTFTAFRFGPVDGGSVRIYLARSARMTAIALTQPPVETADELGRLVLELAALHQLTVGEIGSVLQLEVDEVERIFKGILSSPAQH